MSAVSRTDFAFNQIVLTLLSDFHPHLCDLLVEDHMKGEFQCAKLLVFEGSHYPQGIRLFILLIVLLLSK